jgi:molybdopterin-guanine dinucleotide biosynthesis protein A
MNFTAIILAGGQSSRMGANKALIHYRGKPLIQYSVDLALAFTNEVLISSGNHDLDHLGFPVVADNLAVKAPLAGIHAGLNTSHTDWNLVLTCDMPNISKELIEELLSVTDDNHRMVVPQHDGFLEPLCGFYHRDIIPILENNFLAGKFSVLDLPAEVPHRFVMMTDKVPGEIASLFKNVNEKRDLVG